MKKILVSLVAAATVAGVAAPALAQSNSPTAYTDSYDWKINNAAQQGRISWDQARNLRAQLQQVKPLAWRVQTGEASSWERSRWQSTMDRINGQISGRGGYYYSNNRGYSRQQNWNRDHRDGDRRW